MRWDLFCRVVDNHGDVGVCWRLARDLAARGETVRLWLDDVSALAWMAPPGVVSGVVANVEVLHWTAATAMTTHHEPGDVVIEAFACNPPETFVAAMAQRGPPPVWINLEYLSAEPYVERSHGLPSPQMHGAGGGLMKWFFYPGFTARSGGLLREPGLMAQRREFKPHVWLAERGIEVHPGERIVSVFCYPGAPLLDLAQALADAPTVLLLAPGAAQDGYHQCALPSSVRGIALPWLSQTDYDHLLWSCDLNVVRGEDSAVRAQWAGAPFIWQLYPQHDGAHVAKLQAFAALFGARGVDGLEALWRVWIGAEEGPLVLPAAAAWRQATLAWRDRLLAQADLTTQLLAFVRSRQGARC